MNRYSINGVQRNLLKESNKISVLDDTKFHVIITTVILLCSLCLAGTSAFAQGAATTTATPANQNAGNPLSSQGNTNTAAGNAGNAATFSNINNNTKAAIVEKVSDKGNYRVQIMWNQSSLALPKKGFDMEIDFLNASAPLPSAKTIPPKETGIKSEESTGASATHVPVPSVIQPNVPIDSYDITVYSDHGKVLWSKVNQPATGGRGLQTVRFTDGGYTGLMTIQITKIKSGNIPPNSVTFTAKTGVR